MKTAIQHLWEGLRIALCQSGNNCERIEAARSSLAVAQTDLENVPDEPREQLETALRLMLNETESLDEEQAGNALTDLFSGYLTVLEHRAAAISDKPSDDFVGLCCGR